MRIGEIIKRARGRAGMSQATLAARVGVNEKTVSKWERGVQSPSRHLVAIEDALGVMLTNRQAVPARPTELSQMSSAELINLQMRITHEVARRLPADSNPDSTDWTTTSRTDLYPNGHTGHTRDDVS